MSLASRDVHEAAPQLWLLGPDDPGESPKAALAYCRVGGGLADAASDDPQRGRVVVIPLGQPADEIGHFRRQDGPRSRCRSQSASTARDRLGRGHTVPRRRRPPCSRPRRADRAECGRRCPPREPRACTGHRAPVASRHVRSQGCHSIDVRQRARVASRGAACAGPDPTAAYRSPRISMHVLPSGAFTAMSTMSSSSLPPRRCTSTEPWSSASSASNRTLSTPAGNISCGLELSTRRAT